MKSNNPQIIVDFPRPTDEQLNSLIDLLAEILAKKYIRELDRNRNETVCSERQAESESS